jgi:hypothetical protein
MPTHALRASASSIYFCLFLALINTAAAQSHNGNVATVEALLAGAGLKVDAIPNATGAEESLDVRVRWNAYVTDEENIKPGGAPATPGGGFVIHSARRVPEGRVIARAPELSSNTMIVVATDKDQQVRAWTLVADPRVLRQEEPNQTGELRKQLLHKSKPEFFVSLPDDATVTSLRFYGLLWGGRDFSLELRGTVPFRSPER